MNIHRLAATFGVGAVFFTSTAQAQLAPIYSPPVLPKDEVESVKQPIIIDSETAAIAFAMKLVGCKEITPAVSDLDAQPVPPNTAAKSVPNAIKHLVDSDTTPFLASNVVGTWVWDVELPEVAISIKNEFGPAFKLEAKSVKVRLSAANGDLISMLFTSKVDGPEQELAPYPNAEMAAEYIGRGGDEVWHALVGQPKLSLADALQCMYTQFGLGKFQELRVHCVMWSMMGRSQRPAWSVHVRGLDASEDVESSHEAQRRLEEGRTRFSEQGEPLAEESTIPLSMRNHLRHIIFDDTAQWYTAGTTPQPARLLDWEMKKAEGLLKDDVRAKPATAPLNGGK